MWIWPFIRELWYLEVRSLFWSATSLFALNRNKPNQRNVQFLFITLLDYVKTVCKASQVRKITLEVKPRCLCSLLALLNTLLFHNIKLSSLFLLACTLGKVKYAQLDHYQWTVYAMHRTLSIVDKFFKLKFHQVRYFFNSFYKLFVRLLNLLTNSKIFIRIFFHILSYLRKSILLNIG